jgi:hypothetical protein
MAFKLKTISGLLLVIISCLVVAMLGYRAYAEGFAQPRKNVAREARVSNARNASGKSTATNNNIASKVRTLGESSYK